MSSEAITKNDLTNILNEIAVSPAGNLVGEDVNGDISITRNITAGGNVEAAGGVFGDDVSVTGDITASGDVVVKGNSILSTLFYQPNETVVFAGRWYGFITTGSTQIMFQIPLTKSAALVSSATVVDITGGIRISTGGYADNVTDGTSWKGRSGISFNAPVFYGNKGFLGIIMTKSSAFKQNGTTTNVVNNTPLCLGGNIEIKFT